MEIEGLEKKATKRGSITYWKDGEIKLKQCAKCKEIKPVENFSRRGNGYVYRCKECEKQYYKDNIEQKREHARQYARINKEYYRQYREVNKDKKEEYNKQYYETNKEKQKEYVKQWREDNLEHAKEYSKQWRENNPEYGKQYGKQYRKNNKDENIRRIVQLLIEIKPIFTRLKLPVYGTIYKISNVKTGKVYIGQTIQPLKERYGKDILKGWINERKHCINQKFLDELIEEDFTLTELFDVGCCKYHLNALEAYYINKYNSCDDGYNNYYGNHISKDGIEEFKQILKENNLQFTDGELVNA